MIFFTETSFLLMNKMAFSPIVLIGLLIASLSLILNLKTTNKYIRDFKKHKNLEKFINLIFYTSFALLLLIIVFILSSFICSFYFKLIASIIYILLLLFILYSLGTIILILKEIVRISLKEE